MEKPVNIAPKFFELCDGLEIGEMATTDTFRLADVMSAIELMDPKMDVGVGTHEIKNLTTARANGLNREDMPMQLAIMDATFAMLVAWLEGSSLGSTVWTNMMLGPNRIIEQDAFKPFVKGINLLVRNMYSLINSVGNLEELPEDFNPNVIFMRYHWEPRLTVVTELRNKTEHMKAIKDQWAEKGMGELAGAIAQAIALRYELIILFLEIFHLLIPPEIDDPLYSHRMYVGGNHTIDERELDGLKAASKEEDAEDDQEEDLSDEEATDNSDGTEGSKCREEDFGDDGEDEEEPNPLFRPNFVVAAHLAERLVATAQACKNTVYLGRKGPDCVDGDYSWLPAFDNKACVSMIPACFPRSVQIKNRHEAMEWILKCAHRIYDLTLTTPNSMRDLSTLFYFARTFNLNACVLTRSLLQICMFPTDNHLCGLPNVTIADPIEISLRTGFHPQILQHGSPVSQDPEAYNLYVSFINYMIKLAISVYSSFGCNLSRQRDRLEVAIEELGAIQFHAGRLESRTDQILLEQNLVEKKEENPQFHSVATFVFHNLLAIIHHYFEIGFRMELYVPYEFTYMYWYMGDVESRWMLSTMERSNDIQLNDLKNFEVSCNTNGQKVIPQDALSMAIIMRKRVTANQFAMVNQYAMTYICQGIMKATVVMVRKGYIKMPPGGDEQEALRFERRMEVFEQLGPPLHVTYETYRKEAGVDRMYEMDIDELIKEIEANFADAITNLQSLDNNVEKNRETINLMKAANANKMACSLLKLDINAPPKTPSAKPPQRKTIVWEFNDDYPLWPVLKLALV